ncbi:MAG TPA: hypothetical protein VI756_10445 [Blastocatellia bacterium]
MVKDLNQVLAMPLPYPPVKSDMASSSIKFQAALIRGLLRTHGVDASIVTRRRTYIAVVLHYRCSQQERAALRKKVNEVLWAAFPGMGAVQIS